MVFTMDSHITKLCGACLYCFVNNSPACACVAIDQDSPTPLYIEMFIADYPDEKTGPAPL